LHESCCSSAVSQCSSFALPALRSRVRAYAGTFWLFYLCLSFFIYRTAQTETPYPSFDILPIKPPPRKSKPFFFLISKIQTLFVDTLDVIFYKKKLYTIISNTPPRNFKLCHCPWDNLPTPSYKSTNPVLRTWVSWAGELHQCQWANRSLRRLFSFMICNRHFFLPFFFFGVNRLNCFIIYLSLLQITNLPHKFQFQGGVGSHNLLQTSNNHHLQYEINYLNK